MHIDAYSVRICISEIQWYNWFQTIKNILTNQSKAKINRWFEKIA